jgi:hypothetical protein
MSKCKKDKLCPYLLNLDTSVKNFSDTYHVDLKTVGGESNRDQTEYDITLTYKDETGENYCAYTYESGTGTNLKDGDPQKCNDQNFIDFVSEYGNTVENLLFDNYGSDITPGGSIAGVYSIQGTIYYTRLAIGEDYSCDCPFDPPLQLNLRINRR